MDVHVAMVGEPTPEYINMIKLLLYSLRKNGGALSQAPVTIAINAAPMPEADQRALRRLGPVTIRTMPRQHGDPFADKFNALYAVEDEYDVLIYLDCDVVILGDLAGMVRGVDADQAFFQARTIGEAGTRSAGPYESLVREQVASVDEPLATYSDPRFPTDYPLFNGGVMVLTQKAATIIREEAPEISYALYARRSRESVHSLSQMLAEVWHRIQDRFFPDVGAKSTYEYWMTEQIGVALSVLKHDVDYDILDPRFNWVHDQHPEEGPPPAVYHYMEGRHDIDRTRLFTGAWIDEYLNSESPMPRALATLARTYAAEAPLSSKAERTPY